MTSSKTRRPRPEPDIETGDRSMPDEDARLGLQLAACMETGAACLRRGDNPYRVAAYLDSMGREHP